MPAARSARPSRSGTSSAATRVLRHGSRLLGPAVRRTTISRALLAAAAARDRRRPAARSSTSTTKPNSAGARRAAIADGKVVGWFQGRMEWGPRALGNRSIVCDPRRADMKAILNAKIKRRESFRPFAPSVLRGGRGGMVRGGRRRALHDAGLPDPRREARR